jgi:hypothetical protein
MWLGCLQRPDLDGSQFGGRVIPLLPSDTPDASVVYPEQLFTVGHPLLMPKRIVLLPARRGPMLDGMSVPMLKVVTPA